MKNAEQECPAFFVTCGMENKLEPIKQLLLQKSSAKQKAYRNTRQCFQLIKTTALEIAEQLNKEVNTVDPNVEVKFYEKSDYEFHLKFSGDTLVFMMHTNIFDFEPTHFMQQNKYVKEDPMREFCGMIQVYNFLADSLKFNREGDLGYLVGRIFVNMEAHFFFEGKRPLSFLYSDIGQSKVDKEAAQTILSEAMHYCLNFDLMAPPIDTLNYISVEQKNLMSYSTGMPTGKMLGFRNQSDSDTVTDHP